MKKIYWNIRGIKNFETCDLNTLLQELNKINIEYSSVLYDPLRRLKRNIRTELHRRDSSKKVWVKFTCSWSGYSNNPSAPRRTLGADYKKIDRGIAAKLPKYYSHSFDDGSTNDWRIEVVSVKGNEKPTSYNHQIRDILKKEN